jgi:putative pyruvate formate lyase activating enzyme
MDLTHCTLCPRNCGVDRTAGKRGVCGAGALAAVAAALPHFWEEPCISGSRGSGTVFFSGCSLKCVYCQNHEISTRLAGRELRSVELSDLFRSLADRGVHNINLVNPTHFAAQIAEALNRPLDIPVVYNTGGYEKIETLKALEGKISVYLPDLKYIDGALAGRFSGAFDYFDFASEAILEMVRQTGRFVLDNEGLLTRGVMIRHLILPGFTAQSKRILRWISTYFEPGSVLVSLMSQYTPNGKTDHIPGLNRTLTMREYETVEQALFSLGLEDGYLQELDSSGTRYVPEFDLTEI